MLDRPLLMEQVDVPEQHMRRGELSRNGLGGLAAPGRNRRDPQMRRLALVAILSAEEGLEMIARYLQESLFFVPWSESIDSSRRVAGTIKIDLGRNGSIWLRVVVRGIHGEGSHLRMSSDKGPTLGSVLDRWKKRAMREKISHGPRI